MFNETLQMFTGTTEHLKNKLKLGGEKRMVGSCSTKNGEIGVSAYCRVAEASLFSLASVGNCFHDVKLLSFVLLFKGYKVL